MEFIGIVHKPLCLLFSTWMLSKAGYLIGMIDIDFASDHWFFLAHAHYLILTLNSFLET